MIHLNKLPEMFFVQKGHMVKKYNNPIEQKKINVCNKLKCFPHKRNITHSCFIASCVITIKLF